MLRRLRPALLLLLTLVLAAPASANVPPPRYASPTGTSAQDCTSPANACDIRTAIVGTAGNLPAAGEEVVLEPGAYNLTQTLDPSVSTVIHGVPGQPRPAIRADGFAALYPFTAFNLQISDVDFITHNEGGNDSIVTSGATFDRVLIEGDSGGNLCQCYDGTMRNSVIVDTGTTGAAWGINSNGGAATETLRNDTFIATQASTAAMWMAQGGNPTQPTTIDAKNVIAINTAGGHDVRVTGKMATIAIANSDYANPLVQAPGVLTDGGHNITTPPQFVDAANGDFREQAGSPTVNAGTDDAVNDGSADFAGSPRQTGAHTDIGAFEYQPPAAIAPAAGSGTSAVHGQVFSPPLAAKVSDAQGNGVPDVTVTFTAPASGATGSFTNGASVQATTGPDGVASAPPFTAGSVLGSYDVTASIAEIPGTAALVLQNVAGPPTAITATGGGGSATVGQGFTAPLAAKVTDAQGYPVPNVTVTFTAPGAGPTGAFAGSSTAHVATGPNGVATAPPFTAGHGVGSYHVVASISQISATAAFSLQNLVGPTATLSLMPARSTVPASRAQRFSVTGADAFGNPTSVAPAGVRLTASPSGASCAALTCSALRPGSYRVTATAGAAHGSASLRVTALAPRLRVAARTVLIASRSQTGRLRTTCTAPAGETCIVRGRVTVRLGRRGKLVTLAVISGRLRAGRAGDLLVKVPAAIAPTLAGRGRSAACTLRVSDLSGTANVRLALRLTLAPPARRRH